MKKGISMTIKKHIIAMLTNARDILEEGKTTKVLLAEEEDLKDKIARDNNNLVEELKREREQLKAHVARAKSFLETKDYAALNKYLRLLSQSHTFDFALKVLNKLDENDLRLYYSLFYKVTKSLKEDCDISVEATELYCRSYGTGKAKEENNQLDMTEFGIPELPLKDRPMLLNTWNKAKVSKNLSLINKNNPLDPKFPKSKSEPVENHYYYPIDLLLCYGGNHRQLSALLDNTFTSITTADIIYDISALYEVITFDGNQFKRLDGQPWRYIPDSPTEKLLGIFFEIGRLLKDHPDYFPDIITKALKGSKDRYPS